MQKLLSRIPIPSDAALMDLKIHQGALPIEVRHFQLPASGREQRVHSLGRPASGGPMNLRRPPDVKPNRGSSPTSRILAIPHSLSHTYRDHTQEPISSANRSVLQLRAQGRIALRRRAHRKATYVFPSPCQGTNPSEI